MLAFIRLAVDVVNQRPVFIIQSRLLLVEESQVDDMLLSLQQTVEKVEQQRFRELLTEDPLETHIGKGIDEFRHIYRVLDAVLSTKIIVFLKTAMKEDMIM